MKYIKQLSIILSISFAGEALSAWIPLPVPGSIYGLVLLLACLLTGFIKVSDIREVSSFLIATMPIMFIPSAVGIMDSLGLIQGHLPAMIVIIVASLVLVMAVSGRVTQAVIRRRGRKDGGA